MTTISNISCFRFCWKNEKLDWPKCARTVDFLLVGWIANIFCALAAGSIVSLAAVFWTFLDVTQCEGDYRFYG